MTTIDATSRALLKRDLLLLLGIALASLLLGLGTNRFRGRPLPLRYASKEERLLLEARSLQQPSSSKAELEYIRSDDLRTMQREKSPVILDARPHAFFELGHIPGALSLPRQDFRRAYEQHQHFLDASKDRPLVIYCQGGECEDSELVAKALRQMGFQKISVLMGGWEEWQSQ